MTLQAASVRLPVWLLPNADATTAKVAVLAGKAVGPVYTALAV